jgi:hypothetical protein
MIDTRAFLRQPKSVIFKMMRYIIKSSKKMFIIAAIVTVAIAVAVRIIMSIFNVWTADDSPLFFTVWFMLGFYLMLLPLFTIASYSTCMYTNVDLISFSPPILWQSIPVKQSKLLITHVILTYFAYFYCFIMLIFGLIIVKPDNPVVSFLGRYIVDVPKAAWGRLFETDEMLSGMTVALDRSAYAIILTVIMLPLFLFSVITCAYAISTLWSGSVSYNAKVGINMLFIYGLLFVVFAVGFGWFGGILGNENFNNYLGFLGSVNGEITDGTAAEIALANKVSTAFYPAAAFEVVISVSLLFIINRINSRHYNLV